jgi:hypothetical protein
MAGAAIFLASRAGDYVVGSTLVVDTAAPGRAELTRAQSLHKKIASAALWINNSDVKVSEFQFQ